MRVGCWLMLAIRCHGHLRGNVQGFVRRWAVANYIADGRLVTVGWLRRPDTFSAPCASPIPGIPKSENRFGGCENSVASLVRELLLDHGTGQLISRPIAEYN